VLGTGIYLIDYFSRQEITNILKWWVPWNLRLNLLAILFGVVISYGDLIGSFREFQNRKGVYLVILLLVAFSMASFVAPRTHRIFYDEDIYANIGQNIAVKGETGYCNYGTFEYGEYYPHWVSYNKEPSGWPFLISLAFQLFGTDEFYAFLLNNAIFAFGILIAFFITWHLTGRYFSAFLAALVFALIPHNLIWANTAAAEPSASFFAGLTVLSLIVYLKTCKDRHLFLLLVLFPFASQMRPESILIFVLILFAVLIFSPKTLIDKKVWGIGILTTVFLLPHILHIYAVSGHSWGAEGAKFSLRFFPENISVNGSYYLNNRYFPVVFTLLSIIGLIFSRHSSKWRLVILLWFLIFWGIFLFFYAGSYRYGADVRFSLLSFMPLSILAGMGGGFVREKIAGYKIKDSGCSSLSSGKMDPIPCIILIVILLSFIQFLPLIREVGQEAWGARYDHKYAQEFIKKIPSRSIILTQNPTMFLLWKQNAIQTYAGINNPSLIQFLMKRYQGHVYFHYNYWCNTKSERNRRLCDGIKERYELEEIARAREQDYEYGLYRMSFR